MQQQQQQQQQLQQQSYQPISTPKNEFVPVSVLLNRLSGLAGSSNKDVEVFDLNAYSFITILNNPLQVYNYLRFIDLNDLPITIHGMLKQITDRVILQKKNQKPSSSSCIASNCILTHNELKHNGIRLHLFQALKVMLELTLRIEYRIVLNTSLLSVIETRYNKDTIYLSLAETCSALAPWLRLIRINGQDLIPMIRSKTSWLSNSLSKYVAGLYNTDTSSLLTEQKNTLKRKDDINIGGLIINPNNILNEFEFTNERIAHLVVQLYLPFVYSSFNPVNVIQCLVLYLKNDYTSLQAITTKYGHHQTCLAQDPLTYIQQGLKPLSVFDRLIACKHLLLDRLPITYTHSTTTTSCFLQGVQFFNNLDELLPLLVMYGNYAVATAYLKESNLLFQLQYYLFVPNTTALEVQEYMYVHDRKHVYDVQWSNGLLGCIVPVFMLHDKEITKSNIVRLYSNYNSVKQPNFLFSIMSWFANDKDFVPISCTLTSTELQDLNAFANDNLIIMNHIYMCWEFQIPKGTKRPLIKEDHKHDWERLKKWLLCVGETTRVFVRCLLREKERVFTSGGIFQDSVAYYNKSCDGGTWESQDTEVLIKLMRFVSHLYGATKIAYRQYNPDNKNATEQDKQKALQHLIRVLYCFYCDDLDVLDLSDNSHYHEQEVGDIQDKISKWFTDNRVMTQPTPSPEQEEEEEDWEVVYGYRVIDKWALVRNAFSLVLGGNRDGMNEIRKCTGKYVPFIVFDQDLSKPVLLGSSHTASLVVDCFPCIKSKDVCQVMTSIIRNDIYIDNTYIKPALLNVFTNTARAHVLEPPKQSSSSSSISETFPIGSSKRQVLSCDHISSNKRHRSSLLTSSQESEAEIEAVEEYDPSEPDIMMINGNNNHNRTSSLSTRIQHYGRGSLR